MTKKKELKAQIEKLYQEIKVLNEVDDDCCQRKKIQELTSIINDIGTIIAVEYYTTENPKWLTSLIQF